MVKTICILAGQSGCSRAVVDPDLQIRVGGGAVIQTLRQRGGSGLKNFVLIFFDWKA